MLTTQQKYNLIYKKFEGRNQAGNQLCPICGKHYKESFTQQSLKHHLHKYHLDIYEECVDVLDKYEQARNAEYVICPICGKKAISLLRHLREQHGYVDINDYKLEYPEYPISIKLKRKMGYYKCEICGKEFKYKNEYCKHLKQKHNIISHKDENDIDKPFKCEICGKYRVAIKDHVVRSHNISWENYCKTYNLDVNVKNIFTEKHKQNLSQNKKKFYSETDRGRELRELQRQIWHENNPASTPEARQRLSKFQAERQSAYAYDGTFKLTSYGVKFKCPNIGLHKYCRSFEEFKVAATLYLNNIDYLYEAETINLINCDKYSYLPDFKVNNEFYEIKSSLQRYDADKYKEICSSMRNLGLILHILDYKSFCKILNIKEISNKDLYEFAHQLLYTDQLDICWCRRKGYSNSNILRKICIDYEHHERIHIHEC